MTQPEILVIREKDSFSSILIERGFSVINFPVVKTETLADLSELESCLNQVETFDGIFITSSRAAEIVLAKLNKTRFARLKFFVLGRSSQDLLKNAGFQTFFNEEASGAAELLKLIPKNEIEGKRFLYPRGDRSLRVIPETLESVAEVREVVVYKTVATDEVEKQSDVINGKLKSGLFSAICFFSPSGVEGFLERFADFSRQEMITAVIGRTTAACAEDNGLRVNFVAAKPVAEDFATGLIDFLKVKTER